MNAHGTDQGEWTASFAELAELSSNLASAHHELLEVQQSFSQASWTMRASAEGWTAAQIVEHIFLAQDVLRGEILSHLHDEPRPSLVALMARQRQTLLRMLPGGGKAKAGQRSTAFVGVALSEVGNRVSAADAAFECLLAAAETQPIKAIAWSSPFFGELSAELWMLYLPLHTRRHVGQLRRLAVELCV